VRGTHRYGRILSLLVLFFGLVLARIVGSAPQPAERLLGVLTTQAASLGGPEVVVVSDAEQRAWAERVFGGKAQVSASRPRARLLAQ
jgi:hypothetical protein